MVRRTFVVAGAALMLIGGCGNSPRPPPPDPHSVGPTYARAVSRGDFHAACGLLTRATVDYLGGPVHCPNRLRHVEDPSSVPGHSPYLNLFIGGRTIVEDGQQRLDFGQPPSDTCVPYRFVARPVLNDTARLAQLRTKPQICALLGSPPLITRYRNGYETWTYRSNDPTRERSFGFKHGSVNVSDFT